MNVLTSGPARKGQGRFAAGVLAVALAASFGARATIIGAPIDLSATVHEGLIPGGTIHDNTQSVSGVPTTPVQSVENLYTVSRGQNFSGRSTNVTTGFASSLASSDGNGGVGVTNWIGGNPSSSNPASIEQLVAETTWQQNFTYLGTDPVALSLSLHIPALQVGLIGVAPNRASPSAAETAAARATLEATIIHADASSSPGASFEFGLRAFERQLQLGPGTFANFADVEFLGANASTVSLFDSFTDNGSASNPRFSIDSVFANILLGTLQPGDTVSYVYSLIAEGTTHGGEHGFMAFLGDPFGPGALTDNLVLNLAPVAGTSGTVPEPSTWALVTLPLVCIAGMRTRRRGAVAQAGTAG